MLKELVFYRKDFIYDNGIINFLLLLNNKYGENGEGELERDYEENYIYFKLKNNYYDINFELYNNYFKVGGKEDELKQLLIELFSDNLIYIKESPNRTQYYWNIEELMFKEYPSKYADGFSGGDVINASQLWKPIEELGIEEGEIESQIKTSIPEYAEIIEKLRNNQVYDKSGNELEKERKKIYDKYVKNRKGIKCLKVNGTIQEFNKSFISNYLLSEEIDTRSHPFEIQKSLFSDFISNKKVKIGVLNNIFYQFGTKIGKYFISVWDKKNKSYRKYNYYFYSDSLMDLFDIKLILDIGDKKIENYTEEINGEEREIKNNGNIDFHKELGGLNFYGFSESDNQLKVLLYIFKKFKQLEHGDDEYYSFLNKNPSFYSFEEGDLKNSLYYYQKVNKLFNFFDKLQNIKIETDKVRDGTSLENILFGKDGGILQKISNAKLDGKTPLLLGKFTYNLLNFISLKKIYKMTQEQLLKDKKGTLPEGLKEFEDQYLEQIGKNKDLMYNELCYKIGKDIGRFLALINDNALIFRLRNVKNIGQLKKFISELHFLLLKKTEEGGLKKDTIDSINKLLEILNSSNYETIKDYLSIYTIQQYQRTSYGKKHN